MWHTRKDVQMRCRENRWKQKRETAGAECKVGAVQSGADSIAVHLRQRGISFHTGLQAALWKWVPGSL